MSHSNGIQYGLPQNSTDWMKIIEPGHGDSRVPLNKGLNSAGGGDFNSASTLRAQIAREEWADYKKRFQPEENKLLSIANNPQAFIQQQNQQALGAVNNQFARAPGQINREYNSFGMQYTPDQQSEIQRRLNLNQSLSQVQALNQSTRLANDQILGIMGGGMFQGNKQLIGGLSTKPTEPN